MASSCLLQVHSENWQEPMKLTAQKEDLVKKINERIQSKTKVPVENQLLSWGSQVLKPERKLSHYWLDTSTTIHLTLKVVEPSDEELQVFLVGTNGGKKHLLHIRRSSSVSEVKEKIMAIATLPPKAQRVICNGKELEDGKIMSDYNIQQGCTFFLWGRCIGG
ncbi:ubiquitin D [Monodelphis domestica]|uniref:Ubiquitin D n=1 Tax=Monodelphis domestica TaxID=13616 RepID=F6YUI8_MONDO|nr:ubiquitin D [Monodelphis domestica]